MNSNENEVRYLEIIKQMDLLAVGSCPGSIIWKPKGAALYENLRKFILQEHINAGYQQVKSPSLVSSDLFERFGHSHKYKENIFYLDDVALRPMSCPNHILIYESSQHSFRDLPLKLFEFGEVFRNESSGSLQVLFRQRQFCQDDSHIFAKQSDIKELIINYLKLSKSIYEKLGFKNIEYMISLRPEAKYGDDSLWDKSEQFLKDACDALSLPYGLELGGGAFYGPKIELKVQDKLGRYWQMGVIQLDYVLPERFGLVYNNNENEKEVPVILHHAVLGSLERMIGILLEVFGGDIPELLHPVKSVILPISEKVDDYAQVFRKALINKENYLINECLIDNQNLSLQKRISNALNQHIPNIFVVGMKEVEHYNQHNELKAMLRKDGQNSVFII